MLGIILRVIACLLFLLAGLNQSLLQQSPTDLVAFGLLAWCLGALLGGIGPAWPVRPSQ